MTKYYNTYYPNQKKKEFQLQGYKRVRYACISSPHVAGCHQISSTVAPLACEQPPQTPHEIYRAQFSLACENIRFSSLFAAGDVSRGGTSATQPQKFHTDDANQCLHNKSGSHGVPNINLSDFTCLLVDFGKALLEKRMFSQAKVSPLLIRVKHCHQGNQQGEGEVEIFS